MQQGDQYALPVQITNSSGTVLTPNNCYDVKIQVGDLEEKSYRAGEIFWKANPIDEPEEGEEVVETGYWCYPLSQEETLTLDTATQVQAQVKFVDNTIIGTPVQKLRVGYSIIQTAEWPEPEEG